jgi:hypothetical protein
VELRGRRAEPHRDGALNPIEFRAWVKTIGVAEEDAMSFFAFAGMLLPRVQMNICSLLFCGAARQSTDGIAAYPVPYPQTFTLRCGRE